MKILINIERRETSLLADVCFDWKRHCNRNNHCSIFLFPDLFLDNNYKEPFLNIYFIFFCTTCFNHPALITCVYQLFKIHIHNTKSESDFCLTTWLEIKSESKGLSNNQSPRHCLKNKAPQGLVTPPGKSSLLRRL